MRRRRLGDDAVRSARGLNAAVSIYFLDATLASAFVARWCAGYKVETAEGVFRVRTDERAATAPAAMHRTPRDE
jgi:hypothetical protein